MEVQVKQLKRLDKLTGWQTLGSQPLSEDSLRALLLGSIPAVIIPSFLSLKNCEIIVSNLMEIGMGDYAHVNHSVGRLGLAQMEFHLKGIKRHYFEKVIEAESIFTKTIQGSSENPIQKLIDVLAHNRPSSVAVAQEHDFGRYFAGTYRNVKTVGHLHFDYAPFEAKGWAIDQIQNQLSWNLYLNNPSGGDLHVYNRPYCPHDEALRVAGQYYYDQSIVRDVPRYKYTPQTGDIVIFNSRNFHEVEPVQGNRFTLSSFIGETKSGELILWS